MARTDRTEIPSETAAKVQFLSDRTCCICRIRKKPTQIHHLDGDPGNHAQENLAVLCFECHHETQIRGGFARKLDRHQIVLYRDDWYQTIDRHRHRFEGSDEIQAPNGRESPTPTEVRVQGSFLHISYIKQSETDADHRYSFDADYPQLTPADSAVAIETNLMISALIVEELQRFRASAIATSSYKNDQARLSPQALTNWDDLSVSYQLGLFAGDLLTIDFGFWNYGAGAAHPSSWTKTLNFLLAPSLVLRLEDLFLPGSSYLEAISMHCVSTLLMQTSSDAELQQTRKPWIEKGAGPASANFRNFLIARGGIRFFFDEYSVGPYSDGRREVFISSLTLSALLKPSFKNLLK